MNFSYYSQETAVYCKSSIPYSLISALDECCWCYFYKCYITLDKTIFNSSYSTERDYECQILLCLISFSLRHKNNSLPLFDLRARNFVHAKTSLHARCMHTYQHVGNLSSPDRCLCILYFHIDVMSVVN